jgi:hypothetical protein
MATEEVLDNEYLFPHHTAYYTDEQVRSAYPRIANAATYSLYRYFGRHEDRLREWCVIYDSMYGAEYPLNDSHPH